MFASTRWSKVCLELESYYSITAKKNCQESERQERKSKEHWTLNYS